MKRFLVLILSILYMTSAMGFTVQQHYCMGKLVSAGFTDDGRDECSTNCCDAALKKDCCKDEHKVIKTTDHQLAKSVHLPLHHCVLPQTVVYRRTPYVPIPLKSTEVTNAHAPPSLWRAYPIYLEIRNLRI